MIADSFGDELIRWGYIAGGVGAIMGVSLFAWTQLGLYKIYRWFMRHIEADRRVERINDITAILSPQFAEVKDQIDDKLSKINLRIDNHMNEEEEQLQNSAASSRRLADAQEALTEKFESYDKVNREAHKNYNSRIERLEKLLEA